MIDDSRLLLLDTSIVLHLCRGGTAAERLDERYRLIERSQAPLIAIVSVGEMYAFARSLKWGQEKHRRLQDLLGRLVYTGIDSTPVLTAWADLSTAARAAGRAMGDNDLWIGAVARASGALLLTTDKDFDWLHPALLEREWIDPTSLR